MAVGERERGRGNHGKQAEKRWGEKRKEAERLSDGMPNEGTRCVTC